MSQAQPAGPPVQRPLRLWPGVAAAVLLVVLRFFVPIVVPDAAPIGVIGAVVCTLAILVWWLFFSRVRWAERLGAVAVMIFAGVMTSVLVHESIRGGMMGMMLPVYAIPAVLGPAFVAWAVLSRGASDRSRRAWMVVTIVAACGVWTLLRTDGIKGTEAQLAWRWSKTPEQRLLAQAAQENDEPPDVARGAPVRTGMGTPADTARGGPAETTVSVPAGTARNRSSDTVRAGPAGNAPGAGTETAKEPAPPKGAGTEAVPTAPAAAKAGRPTPPTMEPRAAWPGFRGPDRDGVASSVRIATDWSASPPTQLWHRAVGPGWSSLAVRGGVFYTQEQRGEYEVVSCYKVSTGEPVWRHRDAVRFWESNGGAGPRATPTVSNGRVYTFGATGILNALDAGTGAVVWSRNAASDTHRTVPMWGFASSPLVMDDLVIVAVSGTLAAYDVVSGTSRWVGPSHGGSYSSPHFSTLDGVPQVVLLTGAGATSVAPGDGKLLWEHAWEGTTIVQPAVVGDRDILISTTAATGGEGVRRLAVARSAGKWTVEERWTSRGLKPYFNDYVVHKGHAFGFDGSILSCIDLSDGTRKWKGGRYGNGQLVLLPDQDLLLVLSEEGELALVRAAPDQFTELARFPALEGKTWNHPVLVGDVLLVRNGQEMAAYRLSLEGR